jgi:hypothetical protein
VICNTQKLLNSQQITKIGLRLTSPQSVTFKVGKVEQYSQYDVSTLETFSHDGQGWQEFTLSSPYTVPATGDFYPGIYCASHPNGVMFLDAEYGDQVRSSTGDLTGLQSLGNMASGFNLSLYCKYNNPTISVGTLDDPDLVYTGVLNVVSESITVDFTASDNVHLYVTSSDSVSNDTYSIVGFLPEVELLQRDQNARVASITFLDGTTQTTAASGISGTFEVTETGGSFNWTFVDGVLRSRQAV